MSKSFTQGKWDWKLTPDDRVAITVNGEELHPTMADVRLICAAPEMYNLLHTLKDVWKYLYKGARKTEPYNYILEILARIDGEQEENHE